ncbi:hypothetical protein EDD11_005550 [Mortierella claussenii]|nr:hypothetical protein EDD11_005550 [Mortierella claussenii]
MDTPEIRTILGKVLDMATMTTCSQLSKAWNEALTPHIWHAIDLKKHREFNELEQECIAKHGHHIRTIHFIQRRSELDMFIMEPSISCLTYLDIMIKAPAGYQKLAIQLIHRNLDTLTELEIYGDNKKSRYTEFALEDALVPTRGAFSSSIFPNKLTKLVFRELSMTRQSFSAVLEACPLLTWLEIRYSALYRSMDRHDFTEKDLDEEGQEPEGLFFQHQSVTYLSAPIEQIFKPDPSNPKTATSLLVHFPKVEIWDTWGSIDDNPTTNRQTINSTVRMHFPLLKDLVLYAYNGDEASNILLHAINDVVQMRLRLSSVNPGVILGLLSHQNSMTSLQAIPDDEGEWRYNADQVTDTREDDGDWMTHVLLSKCARLTMVDLHPFQLDMDMVDQFPWACKGLEELRIRVKGLDTKELIMLVIRKWTLACRARRSTASTARLESKETVVMNDVEEHHGHEKTTVIKGDSPANDMSDMDNDTIIDRVVAHLLQFDKLTRVWLGYNIWTVE